MIQTLRHDVTPQDAARLQSLAELNRRRNEAAKRRKADRLPSVPPPRTKEAAEAPAPSIHWSAPFAAMTEEAVNAIRAQIGSVSALERAKECGMAKAAAVGIIGLLLTTAWRIESGKPNATPVPDSIPMKLYNRKVIDKPSMHRLTKAAKGEADLAELTDCCRTLLAFLSVDAGVV